MNAAAFTRLREAFEAALELPPPDRDALLVARLGDAPALLAEARAMLTADATGAGPAGGAATGGAFLEPPGPRTAGAAVTEEAAPLEPGQALADFTLVRPLGRGGMGEVWEARQGRPDRLVALKVLHGGGSVGAGGTRARRRFEDEAELLARLDHPGIARVLAAGVWSEPDDLGGGARPWFALELVREARSLTAHAAGLALERRLRLLIEVCDAVHHGHLRGVVHRDLKPANILVGGDGRLRVIDFGIAHAAGEDGGPRHTLAGELVGTLGYMAPEQVEGREHAVDARADVFALGVLLYELLVGETPWQAEASSWAALAREVTERDPTPPSARVAGLSSELDWIFTRATEKEPERRYASAHELGAELTRFLDHEPLVAGPSTTLYRLAKFARRNRALVGGVLLALVLATGGATGTTWGWLRSLDREERLREAEARADERATRALALNSFLDRMLRAANPLADQVGLAGDTSLADLLLGAAREVDGAFPDDAALEADTRQLIGVALHGQGRHAAAAEQLEAAWNGYLNLGPEHGRQRLQTRRHLATALARAGDPEAGLAHLTEGLDQARAELGAGDEECARIQSDLSWVLLQLGRPAEALAHARSALASLTADHPGSPTTGAATCVARALRDADHPEGLAVTEAAYAEALARARADYGERSVQAGIAASNLGTLQFTEGHPERALASLEEAIALQRAGLGPDNPYLATPLYNLATVQQELGALDAALATIEECLALCERTWGPDHPTTIEAVQARADVLWWQERYDEARPDFERAAAALATDPTRHDMAVMMELRVLEMRIFGKDEQDATTAEAELTRRLERLTKVEPPDSPLRAFGERTRSRVGAMHPGG